MQSILARRAVFAARPRVIGRRNYGTDLPEGHPAGQAVVMKDVAVALVLGTVTGGAWWLWARGQYSKMDGFRSRVAASKQE